MSDPRTTSDAAGARPRGYLPTLDGWRAVAILAVMLAHGTHRIFEPDGTAPNALLYGLTRYGARGVDIFFGLSGFLICTRLIQEHAGHGRIDLKGFYIRRFFRILPPYFVYLGAMALLGAAGILAVTGTELLASVVFVRNYLPVHAPDAWYTGHLWSLAVEEHFYLLWPSLLVVWGIGRARWGVVALCLAIGAWRVMEFRLQLGTTLLPGLGFFERTDVRLDALLWGCWFALLLNRPGVAAWFQRTMTGPVWLGAAGALVACLAWHPPLELVWQSILIPLLIVGTVVRPHGVAGRLLETGPMRWVGRLSYSLYLWQQPFLAMAAATSPTSFALLQTPPINVALVFACAAASYYAVERPLIAMGHRMATPLTEGRE